MKESIDECSQSFLQYIIGKQSESNSKNVYATKAGANKEKLISYALTGKVTKFKLRPMLYKFLLREIHIEKDFDVWITQQMDNYVKYTKLKEEYLNENSLKKLKSKEDDPLHWDSLYQTNELRHLISIDIERTYQEIDIFQKEDIKTMLFNILYTYTLSLQSKTNNKDTYKQGMNEILSMFLLALYPFYFPFAKYSQLSTEESRQNIKNEILIIYKSKVRDDYIKSLYLFFHNNVFLESDLYFLFETFMSKSMLDIYSDDKSKLLNRCKTLIDDKIKLLDSDLYNHFTIVDLQCGIFLERWFKCVFTREFPYEQCLILWDAVIANDLIDNSTKKQTEHGLEFIDYICIAMIESERDLLLLKEEYECLALMLHYPEKEEIFDLVKLAEDKRIVYGDLLRKKEKLLNKGKKEIKEEKKEIKVVEKKGNKLIPENEYDSEEEIKNNNERMFNFKGNSLSAFLNNINSNKGSASYTTNKDFQEKKKIIESKDDVISAKLTIENLYNKYKNYFDSMDQLSFEFALKVLKKDNH